jgi:serine/threonine protein kinase/tetratricopeptide (TPR) repeat protein
MTGSRDDQSPAPTPSRPRRVGWRRWLFGEDEASTAEGLPEATLPARIGRYRVVEKLGQGGMGIVYAALDESLGRRIAVKTITQPDDEARKRFRREARVAARVSHPHVCQLFEIDEDEGRLYIAMELLAGESLAARLGRGPLPLAEALTLGREVLSALGALHAEGIVHRDLKPSNVFLTPHGAKLLDFGLARPLPRSAMGGLDSFESDLTQSGLVVGTPRYMAPEQVRGGEVDARTDLFAAGAVLFEVLAGRPAFPGTTAVDVLHATLHEQPPALTGSAAVVAFDRVIRRALCKNPGDRYPSAADMARDLQAVSLSDSGDARVQARALTRLVVLPFRSLRPDPEVDFLSLALSDAVSGSLRGRPALVVRSSTAGARYAGEAPDLKEIAAQLDVDLVLTGTLLRSGARLRVSAQLAEARSGTLVWSHAVQSEVGDVFQLQDELARGIVESLSLSLAPEEAGRAAEVPRSARAYEFYLRGADAARDMLQLRVARDLYLQCLDEDPGFAPAWAHLGRAHRVIGKYLEVEGWSEHRARAEEALQKALALSPGLPVAHKFYAHLEADLGRARDAVVRLVRVARENRNDPELFTGLVHACRYCGLMEASRAAHREARRLDPHASTSIVHTFWNQGDFEAILHETREDDGEVMRPLALAALGRTREALELWETVEKRELAVPLPPALRVWVDSARGLLHPSPTGEQAIRECLEYSLRHDPEGVFGCAVYACRLGMPGVVEALRQAVEGGFLAVDALASHPWLAGARGQAGFAEVSKRAEALRQDALLAFREAGGEELLGL